MLSRIHTNILKGRILNKKISKKKLIFKHNNDLSFYIIVSIHNFLSKSIHKCMRYKGKSKNLAVSKFFL